MLGVHASARLWHRTPSVFPGYQTGIDPQISADTGTGVDRCRSAFPNAGCRRMRAAHVLRDQFVSLAAIFAIAVMAGSMAAIALAVTFSIIVVSWAAMYDDRPKAGEQ